MPNVSLQVAWTTLLRNTHTSILLLLLLLLKTDKNFYCHSPYVGARTDDIQQYVAHTALNKLTIAVSP